MVETLACTIHIDVADLSQLIVEDERFDAWFRMEIRDQDARTVFDLRKSASFILLINKVQWRTNLNQARLLAILEHRRLFHHLHQKLELADHLMNVKKSQVLRHYPQTRHPASLVSHANQVAPCRAKVSF